MFVTSQIAGACLWYFIVSSGTYTLALLATMIPSMGMLLLMWVSRAGDTYIDARDSLLRPDVALGLAKAVGPMEQSVFSRHMERTQLGFALVNVTVTTNRVLYVVGTLMVLAVYLMPKT